MRLVIIADAFPPMRTSAAVQLRDLAKQLVRQGHEVTVFVSSPGLGQPWALEEYDSVQILRLRTPKTKDTGYIRRTLAELLMPFAMMRNLKKSLLSNENWEGIVWYSPTIFLGPIVSALKKQNSCRSYLIIRDIFPEWAVDMGLMGTGLPYKFFKAIANYQYRLADTIGIQTKGNASYFREWLKVPGRKLEVLNNWIADAPSSGACGINLQDSKLQGRKIFVYAGNMGVAQGMNILLELAESLQEIIEIGFVFVGRGSESARLKKRAQDLELNNTLFFDEIDPDEIPALYEQCDIGLLALDPKHKSHNIPGKFLTYMQAGLPVLAVVNPGNDLIGLIESEQVGRVYSVESNNHLAEIALQLKEEVASNQLIAIRCKGLASKLFSVETAANQIVSALKT